MERLTQAKINAMTSKERNEALGYYENMACNLDYNTNPILSDIIYSNIHILESKIIHQEF